MEGLIANETYRLDVRSGEYPPFAGKLTKGQLESLKTMGLYRQASQEDRVATIIGRLLSGDPTGGKATKEQAMYIKQYMKWLNSGE